MGTTTSRYHGPPKFLLLFWTIKESGIPGVWQSSEPGNVRLYEAEERDKLVSAIDTTAVGILTT